MAKVKTHLYLMSFCIIVFPCVPTLALSSTLPTSWSFQSSSNGGSLGSGTFSFTSAAPHADEVMGSIDNLTSFNWDSGNNLLPTVTLSDLSLFQYSITDPSHSFTKLTFATSFIEINDIPSGLGVEDDSGELYTFSSLQPATTVPIPSAAWLMISGLLGLISFSKKKKQQ